MSNDTIHGIIDAQDALGFTRASAELLLMAATDLENDGGQSAAIAYGANQAIREIRKAHAILDALKGGAA